MNDLSALMSIDEVVKAPTKCMANTIIYKKTSTGATQQWSQEIDGGKYRTISGQVGGKQVISAWTQCITTNEGRANERLPEEQAVFEVNANYKKKLDKDYHLDISNIDEGSNIYEVMLAEDYKKRILKKPTKLVPALNFSDMFSQPKLDGMRCPSMSSGMWTRGGKPIVSCPHIFKVLKPFLDEGIITDGELYNHEFKHDFDELMSIFKQQKPTAEDFAKAEKHGEYHLYDLPSHPGNFAERYAALKALVERINSPYIKLVHTDVITTQSQIEPLNDSYVEMGYEGQILRENVQYVHDRTWALMKNVSFDTAEFELLRIEDAVGNWSGKARKAYLLLPDGREFKADILGKMPFCQKIYENKEKYIGKRTTVRFRGYTPAGIPRFGKCKEFNRIDI